jgi:hypothetical protein
MPVKEEEEEEGCPFALLGLPSHASMREVTRAWRRWLLRVHPDKADDSAAALELTQLLNEAKDDALLLAHDNPHGRASEAVGRALWRKQTARSARAAARQTLQHPPRFAWARPIQVVDEDVAQQTRRWNEWTRTVEAPPPGWRVPTSLLPPS